MSSITIRSACTAVLVVSSLFLTACANGGKAGSTVEEGVQHNTSSADREAIKSKKPVNGRQVTLYINGMGCPQCVTNIDLQLAKLPGVMGPNVDLAKGTVTADLLSGITLPSPYQFAEATADAGLTLAKLEVK